jgi:hypothetical protein
MKHECLDIVVVTDNTDGIYRRPHQIARLLNAAGFPTRSVTVLDRETGLTSTCRNDDVVGR